MSDGGWWPRTPPLPEDLALLVRPDDPDWFAPGVGRRSPVGFWGFMLRWFSWLVGLFGRIEVSGEIGWARRPLPRGDIG